MGIEINFHFWVSEPTPHKMFPDKRLSNGYIFILYFDFTKK